MLMKSFAVLIEIAPRFGEATFEESEEEGGASTCTLTFTEGECAALLAAIAGIEDEVHTAHDRAVASEISVLDRFVMAYIMVGKTGGEAWRCALLEMKTRNGILDKKVTTKEEDSPKSNEKG